MDKGGSDKREDLAVREATSTTIARETFASTAATAQGFEQSPGARLVDVSDRLSIFAELLVTVPTQTSAPRPVH